MKKIAFYTKKLTEGRLLSYIILEGNQKGGQLMNTNKLIQMLRVAKKYYEYHMDQKEIAKEEGISNSTVSRMLQKAIDMGYVKISIDYPFLSNEELSKELKKAYGLKEVFLVPVVVDEPNGILIDTCKAAAAALPGYVESGNMIGTAWGRTMKCLSAYVPDLKVEDIKIVQLNGTYNKADMPAGAEAMIEAMARQGRGNGYIIPAPVVVDTAEMASMLKEDTVVKGTLEMARNCDVAVFSIGLVNEQSMMYQAGYLDEGAFEQLKEIGAVGDICSNYFDINGNLADAVLDQRKIGISLEELKKIPCKIGVVSGSGKASALHGALKGGYIDILYADEALGKALIAYL